MHTIRTVGIIGTAAAILLSGSLTFAEDGVEHATSIRPNVRPVIATTTRMEREAEISTMQASREAAKQEREAAREEAKQQIETAREEAKQKMEAHRQEVEGRLVEIQDTKKKQAAERLAARFGDTNKTWTDHFMNLLDRYDEIIQKMRDRAGIAESTGKDVTAAQSAIQSASDAIVSARAAVVAQAAKVYELDTTTLPVTASSTAQGEFMQALRSSFNNLHSSLYGDLFALRDGSMKGVRSMVEAALRALAQVRGVDEDHSETATTTNQ